MSKIDRILKWVLIVATIVFVAYTLFWVLITYTISNKLQKDFAGKKFALAKTSSITFKEVRAVGFPFKFMVEFIGFTEENEKALITHKDPYRVGYNILNQTFFTEYMGVSEARYKPLGSGFGATIRGKYSVKAGIPTNMTLLRILLTKADPIEMVNFIDHFNINARDVHIQDLIDDSVLIEDADLDVMLHVKKNKHEYYETLDELISDIPNDYHLAFKAHTKDVAPNKKPVPFSMIYLTYLPTDFSYDIDLDLHTEAKEFSINDIFKNFTLTTNKMDFFSKLNSSKSKVKVSRKEIDKKNIGLDVEYQSTINLGEDFINFLEDTRIALIQNISKSTPLYIMVNYLKKLDLKAINLPEKGTPIEIDAKCRVTKNDSNASLNVDRLEVSVKDSKMNLSVAATNNFNGEWVKGIVQIVNADNVIGYLTKTLIRINKAPSSPVIFSEEFWTKLYKEYLKSIANNTSEDKKDLVLEFSVNQDDEKSKFGKYSTAESMLIYYKKLYKHITTRTSNKSESVDLFRKIIPPSIDKPEILEKVIGASGKK